LLDKKTLVHSRDVSINIFSMDDGTLLAEGSLRDNRKFPSYSYAAKRFIDPGDIHHIVVRLYVSADMIAVPGGGICLEIKDSIKNLAGVCVKRGFTKKVLDIMGDVRGCLHIRSLVIAMGSAIVQAQYHRVEKDSPGTDIPEMDTSIFKNSCWLWREGGPYIGKAKS